MCHAHMILEHAISQLNSSSQDALMEAMIVTAAYNILRLLYNVAHSLRNSLPFDADCVSEVCEDGPVSASACHPWGIDVSCWGRGFYVVLLACMYIFVFCSYCKLLWGNW